MDMNNGPQTPPTAPNGWLDILNQILEQFRVVAENVSQIVERTARLEEKTSTIQAALMERSTQSRHLQMIAAVVIGGGIIFLLQHIAWK